MNPVEFVGEGSYGCVFKPALKCADAKRPLQQALPIVSKVFHKDSSAKKEVIEHKRIHVIDPNGEFTVRLFKNCKVKKAAIPPAEFNKCDQHKYRDETYTQLIYENGGMNLEQAVDHVHFESVVSALPSLFKGLEVMESKKYIHNDIKTLNILYNPDTVKASFIDFGLAIPVAKAFNIGKPLESEYIYYPPDYAIFALIMNQGAFYSNSIYNTFKKFKHASPSLEASQLKHIQEFVQDNLLYGYSGFADYFDIDKRFVESQLQMNGIDFSPLLWYKYPVIRVMEAFCAMYEACNLEKSVLNVSWNYDAVVKKYYDTYAAPRIDVYMTGLAMIELMVTMLRKDKVRIDTPTDKDAIREYIALCVRMTDMDCARRCTPREASTLFKTVHTHVINIVSAKHRRTAELSVPDVVSAASAFFKNVVPRSKQVSAKALQSPGRPVSECPVGLVRDPKTKKCVAPCPPGKERNPVTGRCRAICPPGKERNPMTGRCRKIKG